MQGKILVVDDEKAIANVVAFNLKKEGYDVIQAFDGEEALTTAQKENPDLIILDIMMPKMDGLEVSRKIREKSQVPIIMLTARAEEVDKVMGLEFADDYVTKPFGIRELMARVKANLRRPPIKSSVAKEGKILKLGELEIDTSMYEVRKRDIPVELTQREFELVHFLAIQKSQVVSREVLLEKVWDYEYFGDVRTVDVTIRRLRTKLEDNPDKPKYILTKRGIGYYFSSE